MKEAPIRLAMRVEGDWWVAYAAEMQTMDGGIELGRLRFGLVRGHPKIKDGFQALMVKAMTALLEEQGLHPASWEARTAPEHERSGRA
jgi:hypothetical protein